MKVGDWSQDGFTIAHNGVFVSKTQLNQISLGPISITSQTR